MLNEISGVVVSRTYSDVLWVEEDSGNDAAVYALDATGHLLGVVTVKDATNRDWEDIAISKGELFVGDIGDNNRRRENIVVYRFPEPAPENGSVTAERLTLTYGDGEAHNAEGMFVSPNGNLFIVTKEATQAQVFRTDAGAPDGSNGVLELVATLPLEHANAADISPTAVIVKSATTGLLYQRGRSIEKALAGSPCAEPVAGGESIAFDLEHDGYYMIPEGSKPSVWYAAPA